VPELRLFKVGDSFFDDRMTAKAFRDNVNSTEGAKKVKISLGPDHARYGEKHYQSFHPKKSRSVKK